MTTTRRNLLTFLGGTTLLAGCAHTAATVGGPPAPKLTIAQRLAKIREALFNASADLATMIRSFQDTLPILASIKGVDQKIVTKAGVYLDQIKAGAAEIAQANSPDQATTVLAGIRDNVNALVAILLAAPLPPQYHQDVVIAAALLPLVEGAVGIAVNHWNAMHSVA